MSSVVAIATNVVTAHAYEIVYGLNSWSRLTDVERAQVVRLVHVATKVNRRMMLEDARLTADKIVDETLGQVCEAIRARRGER